jgi:hypothetical protein
METLGAIYENASRLNKAGVLVAIQTSDAHNSRNLPYEAGLAVANGLPYEDALRESCEDFSCGRRNRFAGSRKESKSHPRIRRSFRTKNGDPFRFYRRRGDVRQQFSERDVGKVEEKLSDTSIKALHEFNETIILYVNL